MVEASRVNDLLSELIAGIRGCFVRIEPWIQAGKYVRACMSDLGRRNGWSIAEWAGDATPDKTQRLLNHARWDTRGGERDPAVRHQRPWTQPPELPGCGSGCWMRPASRSTARPLRE
jgi:hypothetical protein